MALEDYTAEEQQFITLFAAVLNKAPTPDLIAEAKTYLDAGLSQGALLQVLFDHPAVPYTGFKAAATTNEFLTSLVSNLAAGSGIAASVQAQWVAALAADYAVYSAAGYTKGEFAVALVELLQTLDLPAGSDLAKLANNIDAKGIAAGDAYEAGDTYTTWNALETPQVDPQPNPGDIINIKAGEWDYTGTSGDDTFRALIRDNKNSFESGLTIDGGAGYDTLYAEIGNSQEFSITPWLTNVEKVQIRAQATHSDQADNNVGGATVLDTLAQIMEGLVQSFNIENGFENDSPLVPSELAIVDAYLSAYLLANFRGTQVDAEQTSGVTHWESKNSRADLLIEDVRIADDEITKDITIAFVDSDPGNVDFAVYFDQQSLRKAGATSEGATLVLELLDTRSAVAGTAPLLNSPFDGFTFFIDGQQITVKSPAIDAAQTYPELLAAIQAAVAANPALANFEVSLGSQFTAVDTLTGIPVTGTQIVVTNKGEGVITKGNYTTSDGTVPGSSGLHLVQDDTPPVAEDALITSTVILDNVGRGSTGGDLLIGGLSVGDTSRSKGVEQFDITVEQSSKLQTIASTNNSLEVVNLKSGGTYTDWVDGLPVVRHGNLTVLGSIDQLGSAVFDFDKFGNTHKFVNLTTAGDLPLPGHAVDELSGFGFVDVRVINAADFGGEAFKGDIDVSLLLTGRVVEKYFTRTDEASDLAADDNVEFSYAFGDGNDHFAIAISEENLVRAGATTHEDFELVIDGGKGDDVIKAIIGDTNDSSTEEGLDSWYLNSQLNSNLSIFGGEGNDTVHTIGSGDWFVDLGAGNDTYYADNSGDKAIWVFNAKKASADPLADDLYDIESDANDVYGLYGTTLTVSYTVNHNGDEDTYTTKVAVKVPSSSYKSSDLQINQAIKAAINSDPVLSKLLLAEDGPANTLVVSALIDGVANSTTGLLDGDLSISLKAPTAASLTVAEIAAYASANSVSNDAASVVAAIQAQIDAFVAKGDYQAELLDDNFSIDAYDGSYSDNTADNVVIGGLGDDVIVLGTGDLSNDTVKYVGLGNGYDTIVNFVTGGNGLEYVSDDGAEEYETLTLTFTNTVTGTPAAQTVVFDGATVVLSAPANQAVIPAADVTLQFANQFDSANWAVTSYNTATGVVTLTAKQYGDKTDVVAADITGTYKSAGGGTVTPAVTNQGVAGTIDGTSSTFTVTFDVAGTAATAAGGSSFILPGEAAVPYAVGDGALTLAQKLAAGTYVNWAAGSASVSADGTKVSVTFSAVAEGPQALPTAADLDLTGANIVGTISGTVGTAGTDGYYASADSDPGQDYLDFSSYAGVDHVVVDGVVLVGGSVPTTVGDAWVSLTERATDAGVYDIALHTITSATVTTVDVIGVADFGNTKDFVPENFIV